MKSVKKLKFKSKCKNGDPVPDQDQNNNQEISKIFFEQRTKQMVKSKANVHFDKLKNYSKYEILINSQVNNTNLNATNQIQINIHEENTAKNEAIAKRHTILVNLPDNQHTMVNIQPGKTVLETLAKAMDRRKLFAQLCVVYNVKTKQVQLILFNKI